MRTHRVEETTIAELAKTLDKTISEGRQVASILEGNGTRSTHVLIVSYIDAPDAPAVPVPSVPPAEAVPTPAKTRKTPARKHR